MGQTDPGTIPLDVHQLPAGQLGQLPSPCRVHIQQYITFCNHGHPLLCQQGLPLQNQSVPQTCCVGSCSLCCYRSEGTALVPVLSNCLCPQTVQGPLSLRIPLNPIVPSQR